VVLPESVRENSAINFLGSQFHAQKASLNLLMKSSLLDHFWTRNLLTNILTEEEVVETGAKLDCSPQLSLRHLAQENDISKSSAAGVTKVKLNHTKQNFINYQKTSFHKL